MTDAGIDRWRGGQGLRAGLGPAPVYGVHHLAGHVAADTLEHGPLPARSIAFIVSDGHTSLLLLGDLARGPITHLGDTRDDAAGQAFDKVARILGLGYPGGPAIERPPATGTRPRCTFPARCSTPGSTSPSPDSRALSPATSNAKAPARGSRTSPRLSRKPSPMSWRPRVAQPDLRRTRRRPLDVEI